MNAQGIDLSKWNVKYDPFKKPVDFVIIKATDGRGQDPSFHSLIEDARPVAIKGAYHYYRSGVAWKEQADNFLKAVMPYIKLGVIQLIAVDYETINNILNAGTDAELKALLEYLTLVAGVPVLLYTQYDMVAIEMPDRGSTWMSKFPLWVARWFEKTYYYAQNPLPGIEFKIWQYGGDFRHPKGWVVPGYKQGAEYGVKNDSIDLNKYNGTVAEMRAWLGLKEPELQEARPSSMPMMVRQLRRIPV